MSEIYFIRHGQASALSDNYDQLSELGERQSFLTGAYMGKRIGQCHKIYAGPLQRHLQTADHFQKGWESVNQSGIAEKIILDGLEEHHGYKVIKSILPQLITENKEINELASTPYDSREEQIKLYFKIYEKVSLLWINEELDGLTMGHETWKEFLSRSSEALAQIRKNTGQGEKIIVITSGGPISHGIAESLHLNPQKTLELTWSIHNGSITKFFYRENRFSLSSFNLTHHLEEEGLVTMV